MLDYENQMVIDAFRGSCLLVTGKGMGVDNIFYNFLKLYCDNSVLVLVINCNLEEARFYSGKLRDDEISHEPFIISSDSLTKNHETIYRRGGIIFVSSQILVLDYLLHRVPGPLVTGIILRNAHKVAESSQEAFVLRLFKENSANGFVKAFSESPLSLSTGFSTLDRVMLNLQVKELYLWPRFTLSVVQTLNKCKPIVEEVNVELSAAGISCQMSILDIIKDLLSELKLQNPILNADEFTVENAITSAFDYLIYSYLDPIWNQISRKSRRIINEIKDMKRLLFCVIEQDPITFYVLLEAMKSNAIDDRNNWVMLKSTSSLLNAAKSRLHKDVNFVLDSVKSYKKLQIEIPPKWMKFVEIIKKLKESSSSATDVILVVVNKEATAYLLADVVTFSCEKVLQKVAKKNLKIRISETKPKVSRKKKSDQVVEEVNEGKKDRYSRKEDECCLSLNGDKLFIHFSSEYVYNQSHSPSSNFHNVLRQVKPKFVILYDPHMSHIRALENYQAYLLLRPEEKSDLMTIYFMMYSDSVEEQKYLTALRKEKEAFQFLINAKTNLVLPDSNYDIPKNVYSMSTRIGGDDNVVASIIVDTREFRSDLPALLHRKGFKIEPITLSVGDYVLAPHICVERKSVNDFIGSLNSGRLYNQCTYMVRHYPLPILLIEFSSTSSGRFGTKNVFSLFIGRNQASDEINTKDILSKLSLLTMHFPQLRILWSQSPYATVEMFLDLKIGCPEPCQNKLPENSGSTFSVVNQKHNEDVVDTILKIPGISWKNHGIIVRRIDNMLDLLKFSESDLHGIFENRSVAHSIYSFLHGSKKQLFSDAQKNAESKNFKKPKFDLFRKYEKNK